MFKLSGVATVLTLACAALFSARGQQAPRSSDLPPGPMQGLVRDACTVCHDAGIITQQRLTKEAWTREVDKMVRWGTQLDPPDRQAVIDYLSASFPPDKPAETPARVPKGK
jgi:hypothetical protein